MKTVKMNYPMAILLIIAILAPLTAVGGPRDATVSGPLDDQPWGGEMNLGDYRTGSISSIGNDPYPNKFDIISIRNIGSPLVLIDYLQLLIFDYSVFSQSSSTINKTNITAIPESTSHVRSPIRDKRYSIRKGR